MKFSENWLREWVNPELTTNELADLLTMGGMEVDGVEPAAPAFSGVVVAEILSAEKHPDADKLQVCQVDFGGDEPVQIVCGAANARVGLVTALAAIGGKLPGDFKIKKAKLRGVESYGMLSSASELGLADQADGIIELPSDAPIGRDLRDYLDLNDTIIEVDLTPNRGDCFSIKGIARDLGVLSGAGYQPVEITPVPDEADTSISINVQANNVCPAYAARVITGIDANAETPLWMQERLRRGGVRAIHPVVDVTNYVMLELGQPMHGFDLNKLNGGITVRFADSEEEVTLLDETTLRLTNETLVIADDKGPIALAGIMGGADSAVSDETVDIVLESAFFTPAYMAGKARNYRKQTDSSHRFERGVDVALHAEAIERATGLIQSICGGVAGPVQIIVNDTLLPDRSNIDLQRNRLHAVMGEQVEDAFVTTSLEKLGLGVTTTESGWQAIAPTHRFDLNIEADLIEEICRVRGYDNLPVSEPKIALGIKADYEADTPLDALRAGLVARGYQEAITYSFVEADYQAKLVENAESAISVANPISNDMAVMRTSLLPGLIRTVQHNLNRQHDRVRLFETGLVFSKSADQTEQYPVIAGVVCGPRVPEQWAEKAAPIDFFDLKGDVENLLSEITLPQDFDYERATHKALHPGQAAEIKHKGESLGLFGMLSPAITAELGIQLDVGYFEIDLRKIAKRQIPVFASLSKYPSVRRDISLVVDQTISAGQLIETIWSVAPESMSNLELFDVYVGEGIDSEQKSVALGLIFQGTSSTLTDSDIDASLDKILTELQTRLGATLRA